MVKLCQQFFYNQDAASPGSWRPTEPKGLKRVTYEKVSCQLSDYYYYKKVQLIITTIIMIKMMMDNLSHQTSVCLQHGVCFIDCLLWGEKGRADVSKDCTQHPVRFRAWVDRQNQKLLFASRTKKIKASVFASIEARILLLACVRLNQDLTRTTYSNPLLNSASTSISQLEVGSVP